MDSSQHDGTVLFLLSLFSILIGSIIGIVIGALAVLFFT